MYIFGTAQWECLQFTCNISETEKNNNAEYREPQVRANRSEFHGTSAYYWIFFYTTESKTWTVRHFAYTVAWSKAKHFQLVYIYGIFSVSMKTEKLCFDIWIMAVQFRFIHWYWNIGKYVQRSNLVIQLDLKMIIYALSTRFYRLCLFHLLGDQSVYHNNK